MKCKYCNGKGRILEPFGNRTIPAGCPICGGTGEIEATNEEWFCGLSTEEKAKWLEEKMTWAAQEQGTFTAKGWAKWLKQPHTTRSDK